jgi:hypothetical protein
VDRLRWRRSSYSVGNPEQCVEAALTTDAVLVRDSKSPSGQVLTVTRGQFRSLVESLRVRP